MTLVIIRKANMDKCQDLTDFNKEQDITDQDTPIDVKAQPNPQQRQNQLENKS